MSLCKTGLRDGQGLTSSGVGVNPSLSACPRAPPFISPGMEISRPHPGATTGTGLCWALVPRGSKLSQALFNVHNKEGFELANKDGTEAIPAGVYFYKPGL